MDKRMDSEMETRGFWAYKDHGKEDGNYYIIGYNIGALYRDN